MYTKLLVISVFLIHFLILITARKPIKYSEFDDIIPFADDNVTTYRLPNDTRPETYDVTLTTRVDLMNFTFTGNVKIGILVINETNTITLQHRYLTILDIALFRQDNLEQINIDGYQYDYIREFLTIPISNTSLLIPGDRYIIEINFSGTLRTDYAGFYRSYYTIGGQQIYQATTQFESTDARHGFPCYDEPALKARFTIRITHGPTYNAVSNMPVSEIIENEDGTLTTEFQETPPISTYLIAYVISDFIYTNDTSPKSGLPHRVYSRSNAINETYLALQSGIDLLDVLEAYLNVNYSLPKMDQFAIPLFAAGAMENWGIITYRETQFLFDESIHTYTRKSAAVSTIAHELAHQWFGNLVTPTWWTYLWLNEGFATLYEDYAIQMAYPSWKGMELFVVSTLQGVFSSDASYTSRPMTHYVESPQDIDRLFDSVAYSKSGSVLRMMLHAFTEEAFVRGLYLYLNAREFNDATQEDLFEALQEAVTEYQTLSTNYTVQSIFASWSTQSGFPVLSVNRNYADGSIRLGQERYLTYPNGTQHESTYWIPLNFATANNPDFSNTVANDWFPQYSRIKVITQSNATSNDWIIFNKQQSGYFRVQYDRRNWLLIIDELVHGNYTNIHLLNRAQLIDDAFTHTRNNRLDLSIPLNLLRYLKYEGEYAPWGSANRHFTYLNRYVTSSDYYYLYSEFLRDLSQHLFDVIGIEDIEDEPHLDKYSRTIVINLACTNGLTECRESTNERLKQYMFNNSQLHQNVRTVMLCAGMRLADYNDYNWFWERRAQSEYTTALGCMTNQTLLSDYLNNMFNSTLTAGIRSNIFTSVYQGSYDGLAMAVKFLHSNFNDAVNLFGTTANVNSALQGLSQRSLNEELSTLFFEILDMASQNAAHVNAVNTARNNIFTNTQWTITHGHVFDNFLLQLMSNSSNVRH